VQQIDRLDADRNDVRLHTRSGTQVVHGALGELAERLDPAAFLRVNRSTIVRLDAIKELQPWFHGDYRIVLHDGTELMWSRRYRAKSGARLNLAAGTCDSIADSRGHRRREMVEHTPRDGGVARIVDRDGHRFRPVCDRRRLAHCRPQRCPWRGTSSCDQAPLESGPSRSVTRRQE
jgi:LytTr DNA-binding domain